ncbi:O-antigen ligase family protein [Idiomarina zobellii]|uniref:O-antigen ligase-related domain-containing protein n=1 Tax=Idiomarina zobellii TaxID=86103 RepID=A0A837N6T5_9GAMM|nr:O-antigen ligase family protein [Idiomarina zobellii]KPD22105.1 hypothetical protein AFK76_11290 [Idiomarina zobellii]SDG22859.1 O-antigen ligase like membrane protein [Idiomarina zobellii]
MLQKNYNNTTANSTIKRIRFSVESLFVLSIAFCLLIAFILPIRLQPINLSFFILFSTISIFYFLLKIEKVTLSRYDIYVLSPFFIFLAFEAFSQIRAASDVSIARIVTISGMIIYCIVLLKAFDVENYKKKVKSGIYFGAMLLSIIMIVQFFNPYGINSLYYELLGAERALHYADNNVDRAIGFYGNPNEAGFVMGLAFIFMINNHLRKASNILELTLTSLFFLAIVSSQSRSVWIALTVSFGFYYFSKRLKPKRVLYFILFIICVLSAFFVTDIYEKIYDRFVNMSSFKARVFEVWSDALSTVNNEWFLGLPADARLHSLDNELLNIWLKFGLIPLLTVIVWAVFIFSLSLSYKKINAFNRPLISLLVFLLIYAMAVDVNIFYYNAPIFIFFTMFIYEYKKLKSMSDD